MERRRRPERALGKRAGLAGGARKETEKVEGKRTLFERRRSSTTLEGHETSIARQKGLAERLEACERDGGEGREETQVPRSELSRLSLSPRRPLLLPPSPLPLVQTSPTTTTHTHTPHDHVHRARLQRTKPSGFSPQQRRRIRSRRSCQHGAVRENVQGVDPGPDSLLGQGALFLNSLKKGGDELCYQSSLCKGARAGRCTGDEASLERNQQSSSSCCWRGRRSESRVGEMDKSMFIASSASLEQLSRARSCRSSSGVLRRVVSSSRRASAPSEGPATHSERWEADLLSRFLRCFQ